MAMKTLDLHGIRHGEVDKMVEDFVLANDTPLRVITGNSPTMINIVQTVCERHNLKQDRENDYNLGSRIIVG